MSVFFRRFVQKRADAELIPSGLTNTDRLAHGLAVGSADLTS